MRFFFAEGGEGLEAWCVGTRASGFTALGCRASDFFDCVSQAYIVSAELVGGLGYRASDGLQLRTLLRGHIGETPVGIKLQLANQLSEAPFFSWGDKKHPLYCGENPT